MKKTCEGQKQLAEQMLEFVQKIPGEIGLDWTKDLNFPYHFEAARMSLIPDARRGFFVASFQPA